MVCVILIIQAFLQVVRFRRRRFGLIRRLRIERLMGSWINSLAYQLLTQSESVWVRTYCPRRRWRRRMRSSSSGAIWPRLTEGRR
ncbi:hypothetical protein OIU77_026341 [Salix suchowensis]|uniref:Uncharacterized protein n=1 Tax=Salix suchowensis TaxID=1278906 RepID=A0ABQ9BKS7_9ROSI|nr:hypothetical protein OIU77_026341 [Salix suchowensis]